MTWTAELDGPRAEAAWHNLVELGPSAFHHVAAHLATATNEQIKVRLIQVISQYRCIDAAPLLLRLLNDRAPEVWKTALDAVVTIGGQTVLVGLLEGKSTAAPERRSWFDEAISQVREMHRA